MESRGGRSAPKVPSLRSPTVRSHCVTSLMAQSFVELTLSSVWNVEQMINPILFLFWGTVSLSSLHPLSNTGFEPCSNPSPYVWLMVLPPVRSPVHRCHFCIPPFSRRPLFPLPPSCFPVLITRLVLSGDFRSIYLSVSPLRRSTMLTVLRQGIVITESRCHQLQSINRCICQSHHALKPFTGFKKIRISFQIIDYSE